MSKVRSPARAQVAARLSAGGALALARLGAGDQQGHDRTSAVGDPQQAGPDVAEGVGLDRVGRARGPEVAPAVSQRRAADSGHDPQERQGQPMGHVLGHLHRVVHVLQQADQADPQAEAGDQPHADVEHPAGPDRRRSARPRSEGIRTGSFCDLARISKRGDVLIHLGDRLASLVRAPRPATGTSGARASTPASGPGPPGAGPCRPRARVDTGRRIIAVGVLGHLGLERALSSSSSSDDLAQGIRAYSWAAGSLLKFLTPCA